jgi:zinc protease
VKAEAVRAAVEKAFTHWNGGELPQPAGSTAPTDGTGPQRIAETRDKKQAVLVIGYPGTTFEATDRHALDLLQEACSDLGSRLFLRVREQLGLAYYVGAQQMPGLVPGYFAFYCGTAPEKVSQVETELLKEAELLRTNGLSEEELKRAKAKILGQRKISRQDLGALANGTALDELYGMGFANFEAEDTRIEAVTLADVQAAAQKYLRNERCVISVVSPP